MEGGKPEMRWGKEEGMAGDFLIWGCEERAGVLEVPVDAVMALKVLWYIFYGVYVC